MVTVLGVKAPPNRLAELRRTTGLTRRQLAQAVGVDPGAVKTWERRTSHVPGPRQLMLARLYGVSVAFLMCRDARSSR